MNYTVKTKNFPLTDEQKSLAVNLGISQDFLRLLLGRGMREDELYDFLHPSIDRLSSPFDIDGMAEAVERIKRAIREQQRILIYGDYDCDGICAISTLMLYLKDKIDVDYFIPDRNKDGYGITIDALKNIFGKRSYDLVITVDCGITAVKEVEYLKSIGVDVIVTDHHEPQEEIPSCIVIDAKVARKGFYDLCGAGVAFKLVEALSSRQEACKYLDIVAIATIADVVPLKDDNRIIAYFGLKSISTSPRKGVKMLLGIDKVTAQDVMFKLAPRMNAAGRLNSAMKVVGLFLETDYFLLKTLTEELNRDNNRRQELCEDAVKEAKAMLKGVNFAELGIITLYSENWEPGILGIACSRLVEEFKRPVVLFAKHGEDLKGSARSVSGINIFELFCSLSEHFTSFGGHAQAAGVSMKVDNFADFKECANSLILSKYPANTFCDRVECEMQLPPNTDFLKFAKELELLEPCGYQNPQPTFLIEGENMRFDSIGFSQHVKYSADNIDLLGFSRYSSTLYPRVGKAEFEIALGINTFRNTTTAQGIIQSVRFCELQLSEDESKVLNLHQLGHEGRVSIKNISEDDLKKYARDAFGTLYVCYSKDDYEKLCKFDEIAQLPVFVGDLACLNPETCVLVCPSSDFEFSFYERVIIAGKPLCEGYTAHVAGGSKECFAYGDISAKTLKVSDDTLRSIYKEIALFASHTKKATNARRMYVAICSRVKISEVEFYLAMNIFEQLNLVSILPNGNIEVSRKPVKLQNSVFYRNIEH